MKLFVTELLQTELRRFQSDVQANENVAVCPAIYEIFIGDSEDTAFSVAVDYVGRLSSDKYFLMNGFLVSLSSTVKDKVSSNAFVFYVRDFDSLTLDAVVLERFQTDVGSAQGGLTELFSIPTTALSS